MKRLITQKVFIRAFLTAYFLLSTIFFVMTMSIFELRKSAISVGSTDYGFPFTYYTTHCFGAYYSWFGLIGNVLVAGVISFGIGLGISYSYTKFSSVEFCSKWHI